MKDLFIYVVEPITLAAGSSGTARITLDADSDFELVQFAASTSADAATDILPNNFSVLIRRDTTGQGLMNLRVPQRILCAPANRNAALLQYPVVFSAKETLTFDFLNLTSSQITVTFCMIGYKVRMS